MLEFINTDEKFNLSIDDDQAIINSIYDINLKKNNEDHFIGRFQGRYSKYFLKNHPNFLE